ncbi:MAG: hypothetical protein HYS13_14065 [Planctomycetia bacterium]|nr:hypothetical protein [Planctomycetia bacterium]
MSQHAECTAVDRRTFLSAAAGAGAAVVAGEFCDGLEGPAYKFEPVRIPDWVYGVSRMAFLSPGEVDRAASLGVQVVHGNAVWPYFPLKRDGGGLSKDDEHTLRSFVAGCHQHGMKLCLGLPPFPPAALVEKHPDWRVHPAESAQLKPPDDKNLGTRMGCNAGPWGDYLIDVCAELVEDFGLDGFSFDGNYHPPICFCPHCRESYRTEEGKPLPPRADMDDLAYRKYLVWRGEKLEQHYAKMQKRLKAVNPDAVLMSWTVNAGRYGHFLHLPRAMPTRLNLLFDLPMQEWWLDEANLGASAAPAFGAAYLRATTGNRPAACEPYLMSRGNPYGTDSFPAHERLARTFLAVTNGALAAQSLGWPGHAESAAAALKETARRDTWVLRARPLPWAAMLVSEQTRQFFAYKNVQEFFLPHVFGVFRAAMEEHLPLNLVNDWDLESDRLRQFRVLVLPASAALSDDQVEAVRRFVESGGGLVATGEASLCDELGRPRRDFALADVFGVPYQGRPGRTLKTPARSDSGTVPNEEFWKLRSGVARLSWQEHALVSDPRLKDLVPHKSATFRGPLVAIGEPTRSGEVAMRMTLDGASSHAALPAAIARTCGKGRVVYLAAGIDAALWSYAYPYQRRLLARAIAWAAGEPLPISVEAPMCVQATFFEQSDGPRRRTIIHFFNGLNTAAGHGLPATEVPLREETVPVHGVRVRFAGEAPKKLHVEPGGETPKITRAGDATIVELPPLPLHYLLVVEG